MNEIKGYVVKFTNERGTFYVAAPAWLGEHTIGTGADDDGALFDTLGKAAAASRHPRRTNDVRIFSVASDGTETPLPTYEEALNALAMARDATPAATGAAAIQPGNVVILRDVGSDRSHWSVSFDGPNPAESRCVRCADRGEAEKLKAIVLGGSR